MTALHRSLVLIGLTVVTVVAGVLPASAGFGDTASVPTTVSTATVAPPTAVGTAGSWCFLGFGARVSWTPSPSPDVSGYVVTGHRSNGTTFVVARTGPDAVTASQTYWASGSVHTFTVTAQTPYGWTATSAPSEGFRC
ncbi:hypothetical protein [Blastococcus montanus]|uniref:hypothetical protein n=1 Tax=Blastococcus montanus TaxID=3144973 RepID=UPI0032091653